MTSGEMLLQGATLLAAFFQSATGIGFGMIAGPVMLIVLADSSAIVLSAMMSWVIALGLLPLLWRGAEVRVVGRILAGAALGLPVGLAFLAFADVRLLKLAAGLAIGALTWLMIAGAPALRRPGRGRDLFFSGLGGCLGGAIAIPGPVVALRLTATGHGKVAVRATMVVFVALAWPVLLLAQWASLGIGAETLWAALRLLPATLGGLVLGNLAARMFGEAMFRRLVIGILMLTAASLIVSAARPA